MLEIERLNHQHMKRGYNTYNIGKWESNNTWCRVGRRKKAIKKGENMKEREGKRNLQYRAKQSRTEQKKTNKQEDTKHTRATPFQTQNPFAIQLISRHKEYTIIDPGTYLLLRFHVLRLNSIDLQMLTAIALAILRSSLDIRL